MSRKDYEKVASLLKSKVESAHALSTLEDLVLIQDIAEGMSAIFIADNSAFDKQRFLNACGLGVISYA